MINSRTVISAVNPKLYEGNYTEIFLNVWFEEFVGPLPFIASPFDCERHGKELWIRAMAGEFGEIEVIPVHKIVSVIEKQPLLPYHKLD